MTMNPNWSHRLVEHLLVDKVGMGLIEALT